MDNCSLCGKLNIYYKNKAEHLINSETYENDNIQILADRLLKFEGYERTNNINYPIWICKECRESLENFEKLLKIIKKGRERLQDDDQEKINVEENDFMDLNNLKRKSETTPNILSTKSYNIDDTTKSLKGPPVKRIRRPPKRFLDNSVFISPKPIKIELRQTNNYINTSMALLPKIALIRLSTGPTIGQLMDADNYDVSSRYRITCTICSLVFCFVKEFRKHLENHKEEFEIGSESSKQSAAFENFLYDCEICQKSFQEHYAVRRHYKHAHSQERPFQCAHCTAKFKYKFNLDYHCAKHLNKKNFQCSLCTKKFILRYELMIHQRTHTNEKPYKCQFCTISFAHRSNLLTHRRLHTQNKTIQCAMCQTTFKSLVYLKKHEKNHRKGKGNLLQISTSSYTQDAAEENNENLHNKNSSNVALNTALPNFDTLQSTMMSARLNNNHINNSSSGLNASNEYIDVFHDQDPDTTAIGVHGLTYEKTLSSSNDNILANTLQILKIPETNDNYNNITLSNGEVLKTRTENGLFQIGNTTLKFLQKPQKMNELSICKNSPETKFTDYSHYKQQNMEKSASFLANNKNLTDFENSPKSPLLKIEVNSSSNQQKSNHLANYTKNNDDFSLIQANAINFENSTISLNWKNQENFQYSVENNINNLNSKQIRNDTIGFQNFENSTNSTKDSTLMKSHPNQIKLFSTDTPITHHNYNRFSYTNTTDDENSTKSPNFQNQKNLLNTTDSDSSYNLNDFGKLKNSTKKSTLLKTALNQDTMDITANRSSYDSFSNINMANLKTPTDIEDPKKCISDTNLNAACNIRNPSEFLSFVNLANSPKKISLLKLKENPLLNNFNNKSQNNYVNPLSSSICLPKINMKSFKIVKISGDYLKSKFKTLSNDLNNSPLTLDSSPTPKVTNNLRNPTVLPGCSITQIPKLKYFSNTNKIKQITPSTSNNINWHDSSNDFLATKRSYANGILQPESCHKSPGLQVTNEVISNRNSSLKSGEFPQISPEQHLPFKCVATTNLKEIKIQNTINLSNNFNSKIPKYQPDKTNYNKMELKESCTYNLSKSNNLSLEFNSKPVQILNIKYLKNSSIDCNSPKKIPSQIITNSHDINNIKATTNSTFPPLNSNSLVINSSTTASSSKAAVTLRKTPVKLQNSPKLNILPSLSIAPVISLLKPKIISKPTTSSKAHLITNLEVLAPLQPLQTPPQATASNPQNLLKRIDEYKFQCHNCWKYFKQKSALKKHLRTHTGEKPYKCNLCLKSYADASNYRKHKILHKNAAEALNISRPPQVSPHLPGGQYKQHSPTHSTASDPDPDGLEIMKTIKKFGGSSSSTDENDDDDVDSLSSSSMETYMWQQALGYAINNDEIRDRIIRNLSDINNTIMPPNMESLLNDSLTNTFTGKQSD